MLDNEIEINLIKNIKVISQEDGEETLKKCVTFCTFKNHPIYMALFHIEKKNIIKEEGLEYLQKKS